MTWVTIIAGALLVMVGALQLWRPRTGRRSFSSDPRSGVVLGVAVLLNGLAELPWRSDVLRSGLSLVGMAGLLTAVVLFIRGYQRSLAAHLSDLEAKRHH